MALSQSICRVYFKIIFFMERFVGPFLFLFIRFWVARIFWDSGRCKIQSWPTTVMLFKNEYKVPFLSADFAAFSATAIELICPILLIIGLASRFAAIPMLIMAAVIQCVYLCSNEHIYWSILLGLIICYGPGKISLDFFIRKWLGPKDKDSQFC
ncbi:MAG: DoxX family protein [Alphaproteobacteria bacterium]|nr:DoxX family protein [Alphaproteobacteria bacterium]